jgi:hypothetical protein
LVMDRHAQWLLGGHLLNDDTRNTGRREANPSLRYR